MEYPNPEAADAGVITILEQTTGTRLSPDPLYHLDNELRFCVKGIELHSTEANPHSVARGLSQLQFAAAKFAVESLHDQLIAWNDEDLGVELICSILVTTAELRVLKKGLSLAMIQNASDLSIISDEVPAVIVHQSLGPQLKDYVTDLWNKAKQQIGDNEASLAHLRTALQIAGVESYDLPQPWSIDMLLKSAAERVLVVTLDELNNVVERLRGSVHDAVRHGRKLARLERNLDGTTVWESILP